MIILDILRCKGIAEEQALPIASEAITNVLETEALPQRDLRHWLATVTYRARIDVWRKELPWPSLDEKAQEELVAAKPDISPLPSIDDLLERLTVRKPELAARLLKTYTESKATPTLIGVFLAVLLDADATLAPTLLHGLACRTQQDAATALGINRQAFQRQRQKVIELLQRTFAE